MQVVTWRGNANFTLDNVPKPSLTDNGEQEFEAVTPSLPQKWSTPAANKSVLVKIDTVGVCGTDVHITQGLFPSTPPKVLGHEGSGIIIEVGESIDPSRIGERVALNTTSHCGICNACRTWSFSRCERAEATSGMFAEYAVAPSQSAVSIPDRLDLEHAALTEPAACCLSGAEMMNVEQCDLGVVVGGGIMGLFTLAFLKKRGVKTMVMSEPVKARREMAVQFGADLLHDPMSSDLDEFIKDHTNGHGADIAAEVVGKPELVAQCISVVRPRGQVLMVGVSPEGAPLPSDLYNLHYREITLKGAFGRGNVFARTPEEIADLDFTGIISGRYDLENAQQAIIDSGEATGIKFVVKPNGYRQC